MATSPTAPAYVELLAEYNTHSSEGPGPTNPCTRLEKAEETLNRLRHLVQNPTNLSVKERRMAVVLPVFLHGQISLLRPACAEFSSTATTLASAVKSGSPCQRLSEFRATVATLEGINRASSLQTPPGKQSIQPEFYKFIEAVEEECRNDSDRDTQFE